ncbi:MAG: molybdopterin biosynthesis protein [Thaumarchaeota archaeon]|nr:MAG: molybdopterin biosynthesis protein [Nitrososphaerota archaeon]
MRRIFHRLLSPEEALKTIEERIKSMKKPEREVVKISEALGRILAEDIYAKVDSPPFDRAIVDGYAVRAEDVYQADEANPVKLKLIGEIEVGEIPRMELRSGECVEIATGALMPRGADAVVMVEYTKRSGDYVLIYRGVHPGENVAQTGSDITAGDLVLRKGKRLNSRDIAVLAAVGYDRVIVYKRLRVAFFSTGNELISPPNPLKPGKIYDVNGYVIPAMLRDLGLDADFLGILPDKYEIMLKSIREALNEYDVVMTSGSTSAGAGDVIYRIFDELGEIVVHGLRVKPGKPTIIGLSRNGKLLVGLPGFPLSCAMVFIHLIKPLLNELSGAEEEFHYWKVKAMLPMRIETRGGKTWYIPVQIVDSPRGLMAYPILRGSGSASTLAESDGFIAIPEDTLFIDEGEDVEVNLFEELRLPSISIIGSHCPGIDLILNLGEIYDAKVINVGSLSGWKALKLGTADVAGTHLLDGKTMRYNLHMPEELGLRDEVEIYGGYIREVGFIVAEGNPKKIKGFEDLLRKDVIFVNRVKGSGIRTLIDIELKRMGIMDPEKRIKGYVYEAKTHTAVASAVKNGRADVGVGIGYVAKLYGLDFIPIREERFDFAVRRDRLYKPAVKKFLKILKSERFAEELNRLPHYRVHEQTGKRIYP